MNRLDENVLEEVALAWFETIGFDAFRGAEISPGGDNPLRESY